MKTSGDTMVISGLEQEASAKTREAGGCRELDLRDKDDCRYFMQSFGGEDFCEKSLPYVFGAVQEQKKLVMAAAVSNKAKSSAYFEHYGLTAVSSKKIEISNNLESRFLGEQNQIIANRSLYDLLSPYEVYLVDSTTNNAESTDSLRASYTSEVVPQYDREKVTYRSTGLVTGYRGTIIKPLQVEYEETEIKSTSSDVVSSFTVLDPSRKGRHQDYSIKVSYNRDSHVKDADYTIDNSPSGNRINFLLPVSVSIETDAIHTVLGISDEKGSRVYFSPPGGGMITHLDLRPAYTISNKNGGTNNCAAITFPTDWKNYLDFKNLENKININLDMYGQFFVDICPKGKPQYKFTISCSFNTKNGVETKMNKVIPKIFMQWGCMAGDTEIIMADGSKKRLFKIEVGDEVLAAYDAAAGNGGVPVKVKNVHSGDEKEIISIRTEKGIELLVTSQHTVFTPRGPVPACYLKLGDQLLTSFLENDKIAEKKQINFREKVYNLEFEKPIAIYANDIKVGDYALQQLVKAPKEPNVEVLSTQAKGLMKDLNKFLVLKQRGIIK